jgi:hypothetical protein
MQFCKAIEQLLWVAVRGDPKFGLLLQYRLDIFDGFYWIALSMSGVQKLGVLLPNFPGLPPLVAFPSHPPHVLDGFATLLLCLHGDNL